MPHNVSFMCACIVSVHPDLNLGVSRLRNVVTGPDMVQAIRTLYTDERWRAGFATLWVCTESSELVCTTEDAYEILAALEELRDARRGGRLAFVVRREIEHDLLFLLTVKDQESERPTAFFRNIGAALAWLGMDEGILPRISVT